MVSIYGYKNLSESGETSTTDENSKREITTMSQSVRVVEHKPPLISCALYFRFPSARSLVLVRCPVFQEELVRLSAICKTVYYWCSGPLRWNNEHVIIYIIYTHLEQTTRLTCRHEQTTDSGLTNLCQCSFRWSSAHCFVLPAVYEGNVSYIIHRLHLSVFRTCSQFISIFPPPFSLPPSVHQPLQTLVLIDWLAIFNLSVCMPVCLPLWCQGIS